jgi:hypothetical protein
LLIAQHPAMLGTALVELVATHLAGARPDLRDKAGVKFIAAVTIQIFLINNQN